MGHRPAFLPFAALAFLALCSSCAYTGDPKPVTSEYMRVFGAGFAYENKTRLWKMFIDVVPSRQTRDGGPIYLEATFENPQPGAGALVARGDSSQATRIGVDLKTAPVKGMQNGKIYTIIVRAYADKAHTQLLDTLSQAMVYHDVGDPEAVMHGGPLPRGMRMATPSGAGR